MFIRGLLVFGVCLDIPSYRHLEAFLLLLYFQTPGSYFSDIHPRLVIGTKIRAHGGFPYGRWTLRLLADELVTLDVVDSISHETVRQTLKKTA